MTRHSAIVAGGGAPQDAFGQLDQAEALERFSGFGVGVDTLVPRSRARSLPDSLVGSITIRVNGEQAMDFYLADEKKQQAQGQLIAPEMQERLTQFSARAKRLLR